MMPALPDRFDLEGAVMRRLRVDDAALLARAVAESLDHLRPWMPWATAEATDQDVQRARLEQAAMPEATEREAHYLLLDRPETALLGTASLVDRIRPGVLEIGYWIHVDHTGRGLATRSAALLTDAALASPGVEQVEIHCDEANRPSAAVPRRLGFRLDRIDEREIQAPGETGREMIWVRRRPF